MKKNLLIAALLVAVVSGLCAQSAKAALAAPMVSTGTAVSWPDYHARPWKLNKKVDLISTIPYAPKGNDYVVGLGAFDVRIGTVSFYMDAPDPSQAAMMIMEGSILGNDAVIRRMYVVDIGPIDLQLKVKGVWWSVPPGYPVKFTVADPDGVINRNTMTSVTVTVTDESDKVVNEVRFENKNRKK